MTPKDNVKQAKIIAHDRKAEIKLALKRFASENRPPPGLQKEVDEYLGDTSIPAADRYDIRSAMLQFDLGNAQNKTRESQLSHRARHARQLVAEFPTEERAYSYYLQVAAAFPPAEAKEMAGELLRSSAPSKMKDAAGRIIAKCELLGKPIAVPDVDFAPFKGRPLVIYTWSSDLAGNLEAIKHWAEMPGVGFLAINLDSDTEGAKVKADALAVPGVRLYEPQGLDGPLSRALQFTSRTSVYIVDNEGVLIDIGGSGGVVKKLKMLIQK